MARQQSKMPYIERRDNGIYYVHYYNRPKKRWDKLSLETRDEREAMQRYMAWMQQEYDLESCAIRDVPAQETVTCGQVLDYYKETRIDRDAADPYSQAHKQKWTRQHFGDLPVAQLTQDRVWEYVDKRKAGEIGRGANGPAVRVEVKQLLTAIKHAKDKHAFDKALVGLDLPKFDLPATSQPRTTWLTDAQLEAFFEACRWETDGAGHNPYRPNRMSRVYRWAVLAYYSAARREALENLTWAQVSFDSMTINLLPAGERQTSKRRVAVPITDEYAGFMRAMWNERESDLGYVLDRKSDLYHPITRAFRWAGLEWAVPHTLRHTRAVRLAQEGIDLYTICGLLGDSYRTVEKNYLHHCPHHLRRSIEQGLAGKSQVDLESLRAVNAGPSTGGM